MFVTVQGHSTSGSCLDVARAYPFIYKKKRILVLMHSAFKMSRYYAFKRKERSHTSKKKATSCVTVRQSNARVMSAEMLPWHWREVYSSRLL